MWGSKSRRIAELKAHVAYLRKALDNARGTTVQPVKASPDWQKLAMQYAEDRVAEAQAAGREMARLQDVAEGWAKLARTDERRSVRLARAVYRYWAEIGRLRKTVAARDASIKALQDRLVDREGGDRAVMPAIPRKGDSAEVRLLKAQITKLEGQLHVLQTANENSDWRTHRAGAVLKQAS